MFAFQTDGSRGRDHFVASCMRGRPSVRRAQCLGPTQTNTRVGRSHRPRKRDGMGGLDVVWKVGHGRSAG